jgi:hypothetical protein
MIKRQRNYWQQLESPRTDPRFIRTSAEAGQAAPAAAFAKRNPPKNMA